MMLRFLGSVGLVLILTVSLFAVAVDDKPLKDPAKEAVARALMKEIRCLVCQNQSIEDSNADLARDLRRVVRERIALGDSPANVRSYLVDRYGDWVLLEPPVKASTYLLWGSPFLLLLFVVVGLMRNRKKQAGPAPLTQEEQEKLDAILREGEKE